MGNDVDTVEDSGLRAIAHGPRLPELERIATDINDLMSEMMAGMITEHEAMERHKDALVGLSPDELRYMKVIMCDRMIAELREAVAMGLMSREESRDRMAGVYGVLDDGQQAELIRRLVDQAREAGGTLSERVMAFVRSKGVDAEDLAAPDEDDGSL